MLENRFWMSMIFAVIVVFFQRNDPKSAWAWVMTMYLFPIAGFLLYLLFHQNFRSMHMFYRKELQDNRTIMKHQKELTQALQPFARTKPYLKAYEGLIRYNEEAGGAVYTEDNIVEVITDGEWLFQRILKEIDEAREFIHMEYYIIRNDTVFDQIKQRLCEKAKQGVRIRILYDAFGSRSISRRTWEEMRQQGIMAAAFFPVKFGKMHIRMNYHNHRKLIVIDNRVAFMGGYNIGKEYVSLDKRFGYWRDTHMQFSGSCVIALGIRFLMDWNYAAKENLFRTMRYWKESISYQQGAAGVQIIASGPDRKESVIRNTYVELIHRARHHIYIQTPYFIPDQAVMTALEIAIVSGVKVKLMIPCKPDHPFVYWATYSYMGELLEKGAECYIYEQGFLHAKGVVIDSGIACYGTANMDIRSFELNFEMNAVIYDKDTAQVFEKLFEKDIKYCKRITKNSYEKRGIVIRLKEQLARLLSPVL